MRKSLSKAKNIPAVIAVANNVVTRALMTSNGRLGAPGSWPTVRFFSFSTPKGRVMKRTSHHTTKNVARTLIQDIVIPSGLLKLN